MFMNTSSCENNHCRVDEAMSKPNFQAFPLSVIEFPLAEEVPIASEECFHCQKKRDATAKRIALVVIEFGDSYEVPASIASTTTTDTTSGGTGKKSGRTVTLAAEDMQKRKNDVKARTTLLLSLPDKHQQPFSKYKTTQEIWAAILKTFSGNEATKKTKKNLLKQQYGNFKAEGSETLEQMFNRLQVIVGQLQLMDVEVEHDDLNQKFLTSLALEWLMHTIVWRNRSDLDTMSLDDLYNHLKDINQIDEDDMEEMDIKWSMALLSMRADKFWKKTGKKISIQGSNVAGSDKSKVECFNCHKMGHFARECRASRSQDRGKRDNYRQGSKVEEQAPKALMAIYGVGWDWSYMANDKEVHALVANKEAPTEFALMANTSAESKVFDNSLCSKDCKKNNDSLNSKITDLTDKLFDAKNMIYHYKLGLAQVESRLVEHKDREIKYCEKIRGLEFRTESSNDYIEILKKELDTPKKEKEGVDGKLAGFLTASKDLDNLIESQRSDKNKEGLGYRYSAVPPPPTQIYCSPKKDLSWTSLPENPSVHETDSSPSTITPKPFIKFVKPNNSPSKSKTCKTETPKKPPVKYAEQYIKPNKKLNVRGNQRNWNNLKSHQLGPNFVMKKKACFNCGHFDHLSYDCRKMVKKGTSRSQNNTHESFIPRPVVHRPYRPPVKPMRTNMNGARPNKTSFNKQAHSYANRPFQRTSSVRSQFRAPWVPTANRNFTPGSSRNNIDGKGYWDSGCSRHMTGNISYLSDYEPFDGGYVSFGQKGCKITGKGTIKTECIVLGRDFKLFDDANILLRTRRQHNMYSIDLNNIVSHKDLTCLVAKASADECMLWHRRLGHLNFKIMNKLVRDNLVRGLPTKCFENDHTCTACLKGKQHKASCKSKLVNSVTKPLHTLHMDLFGPTSVSSISHKWYCLVVTDDFSSTEVPESSGNTNPTASTSNPPANQMETLTVESPIPTVSSPVLTTCFTDSLEPSNILGVTINPDESNGVEADVSNMETTITASPTPTLRIHKDHPKSQIIGHVDTPIQTRNKSKEVGEPKPKKISDALQDPSWVEAMQEELIQFKIQRVWTLVDCPKGVRPIRTKWVLKNKKDERRIVIINKARLVAQGHTQEEGIDYDEVFAPVARIKAIRLFLAYASFMGFTVYQMDVKSAFFYGTIDKEVYVMQPPGFQDLEFPARVYKVEKSIEFKAFMHEKFQMSAMGELNFFLGLQVLHKEDDIFLSQDKYVGDILKKFGYSEVRSSNTLMDKENPWGKDETGKDVDLHLYRSMIGSLMYLTASRPDIMFVVCVCARHQVTPKECHLYAVKRIFRYLKGHPKLRLWYPKESSFDLVAYL
nr:putative reverse transcriptase, RNA-dependent DNA polymerase [Tanacetum cinerariifolium]